MPGVSYLDFDLQIQRHEGGYRAEADAPAGQAAATFTTPFSDLELENFLLKVGRTRRLVRRVESPEIAAARTFGERLFETVFSGELRGVLRSSIEEARRQGRGLRVRLRLTDAPELVDLPWEYLYNSTFNRFLCLSVETPLVRYLELPELVKPLLVSPPLNVLVMIASPPGYPLLDVDREWEKLREALSGLVQRGLVTLDRLSDPTLSGLQRQLRRGEYHVFHFIGHGGFDPATQDGVLLLQDDDHRGRLVSGRDLGVMLHDHRAMRLVVLNACEGARTSRTDPFAGAAQSLVQQGLAAVIAMQFEITDEAAITFSHEFYAALADGYAVDASLGEARKAIFAQENGLEWGTPVLYMRTPDGRVFDVQPLTRAVPELGPGVGRSMSERDVASPSVDTPARTDVSRRADARIDHRDTAGSRPAAHRRRARTVQMVVALLLVAVGGLAAFLLRGQGPHVETFAVDPSTATVGGAVILRWRVSGADAVEIAPPVGEAALDPRTGSVTIPVSVPGTQSFTLRARRGAQVREHTVAVTVRRRPPVVRVFDTAAGPSGRILLRWEVDHATVVRLDPGPGRVQSAGRLAVEPPPTGQVAYRLTATNPDHDPLERVIVVTAVRPPVISRFEAQPAEVRAGASVVLSWSAPGATTVTLSGGVGDVPAPSGTRTVSPPTSLQYVLTASNAHGAVTRAVTVRVRPAVVVGPTRRAAATPRSILTPRAVFTPRTAATPSGTPVPGATPAATPQPQATVDVIHPPAAELSIAKATIALGDGTELCWITFNARSARIEPDIGELSPREVEKGCRTITPRQTTTYVITVAGGDGRTVRKQVTVEVQVLDVQIVEFSARGTMLAPGETTRICWVVANARSVRLDPEFGELPRTELEKGCREIAPRNTTTYFLIATGRDGKTVTRTLLVAVRRR